MILFMYEVSHENDFLTNTTEKKDILEKKYSYKYMHIY